MPRGLVKGDVLPQTEDNEGPSTPRKVVVAKKKAASVSPTRVREGTKMTAGEKILLATPSKSRVRSTSNTPVVSPVKSSPGKSMALIGDEEDDDLFTPVAASSPGRRKKGVAVILTPSTDIPSPRFGTVKSKLPINPRVEKVYQIIRACTGTLGGNGTTGAIYGELTMGSMQRVINLMIEKCEMNDQSRFIDVGAGLGKYIGDV